jgi:hypothetical protein
MGVPNDLCQLLLQPFLSIQKSKRNCKSVNNSTTHGVGTIKLCGRHATRICSGMGRQTGHGNTDYGNGPFNEPGVSTVLEKAEEIERGMEQIYKRRFGCFCIAYLKRGVIVLSPPPPERFHLTGQTNYQAIEEPISKREKEGSSRL